MLVNVCADKDHEIERLRAVVFNDEHRFERTTLERHCFRHLEILVTHRLGVIARREFHRHGRFVAVSRGDERPVDVTRETVRLNGARAELRPAVR